MFVLVTIKIIAGELTVAAMLNKQLKNFAIRIDSMTFIAWSTHLQGLIHFCRSELDLAIHHFRQAAELGYILLRRANVDGLAGLALAYQAMNQTDKAAAALERLLDYIHSLSDPALLDFAHSCRAHISLMKKEAPFASGLPRINATSGGEVMVLWMEIPGITQCRVLLAEGSDEGLGEAEKRLQEYLRLSRTQHNTFQTITIMALQAVTLEKQGRTDDALAVLETAIDLARPGGFIRPFVELGPSMEGLLKRLAEKNVASGYIGQLLAAFSPSPQPPPSSAQPSDVQLTNRECDILELLAQRLQTKEIADKLSISTETVNTHLRNIYGKLNVHNRRQAVARAKGLGIL
jgi:LuxR family maltose regulon positive regulatory protein